jgi:hypothetical protein
MDLMKLFNLNNIETIKTEEQRELPSPETQRLSEVQQAVAQNGNFMFASILMSLDAGVPREDLVAGYGEKLVKDAEESRAS